MSKTVEIIFDNNIFWMLLTVFVQKCLNPHFWLKIVNFNQKRSFKITFGAKEAFFVILSGIFGYLGFGSNLIHTECLYIHHQYVKEVPWRTLPPLQKLYFEHFTMALLSYWAKFTRISVHITLHPFIQAFIPLAKDPTPSAI